MALKYVLQPYPYTLEQLSGPGGVPDSHLDEYVRSIALCKIPSELLIDLREEVTRMALAAYHHSQNLFASGERTWRYEIASAFYCQLSRQQRVLDMEVTFRTDAEACGNEIARINHPKHTERRKRSLIMSEA